MSSFGVKGGRNGGMAGKEGWDVNRFTHRQATNQNSFTTQSHIELWAMSQPGRFSDAYLVEFYRCR